jgi:hypothetical protein
METIHQHSSLMHWDSARIPHMQEHTPCVQVDIQFKPNNYSLLTANNGVIQKLSGSTSAGDRDRDGKGTATRLAVHWNVLIYTALRRITHGMKIVILNSQIICQVRLSRDSFYMIEKQIHNKCKLKFKSVCLLQTALHKDEMVCNEN